MASDQYPNKPTIVRLGEFRIVICINENWDEAQALEFIERALENLGAHPCKLSQIPGCELCPEHPGFKHITFTR